MDQNAVLTEEPNSSFELSLTNHHPQHAEAGCRSCDRVFASDKAFDRHRTGHIGEGRNCSENLSEAGLELDIRGRWRVPKSPTKRSSYV